ncbi:gp117 (endogenous virus) [Lactococcus phage KSY1]|uniref:Gp117 n=1 Tax=Lactococcus phage KSY1 TaxID=2913972 RepID=A6MAI2_9CAUD|nr:gp117 [Lactococcus phage KSY1]ABG21660.1 gp117 [Lactococcus phage KSY1]
MRKLRIISPICLILGHDFQFDHNLFTQTNGKKTVICTRCDKVE